MFLNFVLVIAMFVAIDATPIADHSDQCSLKYYPCSDRETGQMTTCFYLDCQDSDESSDSASAYLSDDDEDDIDQLSDSLNLDSKRASSGFMRVGKRAYSGFMRVGKRAGSGFMRVGKRSDDDADDDDNTMAWLLDDDSDESLDKRASGFMRVGRGSRNPRRKFGRSLKRTKTVAIATDNGRWGRMLATKNRGGKFSGFMRVGKK